jgi:hypothetical protein
VFQIVAARFDEFQLFKAGGIWGDVEYIAYSTWSIDGKYIPSMRRDLVGAFEANLQ